MDIDVLTISTALIIHIWLQNTLESLKVFSFVVLLFGFFPSMDFGKDLMATHGMYANFIESFGDPGPGLCSPTLDFSSDIYRICMSFSLVNYI